MSKEKANERINRQLSPSGNRKSRTGLIIAFAAIAACAAIGIIAMGLGKDAGDSYNRVVTPDNVDEVIKQLEMSNQQVSSDRYVALMNYSWTFPDGDSASSDAYVENSPQNQFPVYFTVALADDRNNVIYTSPDIPVGSRLENIKLDKALDAGVYDTVITYYLLGDNRQVRSHVSMTLTITIEK